MKTLLGFERSDIPELRTPLWDHQLRAFNFVANLWEMAPGYEPNRPGGAMLNLDVRTGKTLTTIALILAAAFRSVLVTCPKSVVPVWGAEFAEHSTAELVISAPIAGTIAQRAASLLEAHAEAQKRELPFVAVLNYDAVWRLPPELLALLKRFDCFALDESHRIKGPARPENKAKKTPAKGHTAQFFYDLGDTIPYKLGLTATIAPHSPLDLWSQFRAIHPYTFGRNFYSFRNRYCEMGGYDDKQVVGFTDTADMNRRLYTRTITITKAEALPNLPPVQHIVRPCVMSVKAERVYRDLDDSLYAGTEAGPVTAANGLVKITRLQQVTSGYVPTDGGEISELDSAKADALEDLLQDTPLSDPVVVFAKFHHDLDATVAVAKRVKRKVFELSGRRNQLQKWKDAAHSEGAVLAVQYQAGGAGIDLSQASITVFYSGTHDGGAYEQALGRTHGPKSQRSVAYYHLISTRSDEEFSIDELIAQALRQKRDVVRYVLDFHRTHPRDKRARRVA